MLQPAAFSHYRGRRLHLGVCGSISAYKSIELMRLLQKTGIDVGITLTEAAKQFITPLVFESLGAEPVFTRMFGQDEGVSFGHLAPGQTSQALVIAPATAAILGRAAHGLADDILAAQVLSFPGPVWFAPAMNPKMWSNAATQANVALLQSRGHRFVLPDSGVVACGDEGQGKLAGLSQLYFACLQALSPADLAGKTVLVTLGPTREQWDGVRCWTNLSTGRMGTALVEAAWLRGAQVHAVAGPGVPDLPPGVMRHNVGSAMEMFDAAKAIWSQCYWGLFTAAVADFAPVPLGSEKFKKHAAAEGFTVSFVTNPDILATLSASKGAHQKVLGFAAETSDLESQVRVKLERKNAHMIAGNLVGGSDSGFAASTNKMYVLDHTGKSEHWPLMDKSDVAWRLIDWLLTL